MCRYPVWEPGLGQGSLPWRIRVLVQTGSSILAIRPCAQANALLRIPSLTYGYGHKGVGAPDQPIARATGGGWSASRAAAPRGVLVWQVRASLIPLGRSVTFSSASLSRFIGSWAKIPTSGRAVLRSPGTGSGPWRSKDQEDSGTGARAPRKHPGAERRPVIRCRQGLDNAVVDTDRVPA